ncbi:MAG: ADP-ribosylglycohydrolase family protein [Phycisphaerales bacterium]|nr:ADP-ribosylglycohydrolase family protein [Phycisphaerales bacterium]
MKPEISDPLQRARLALEGLALGDAFGECFFEPALVHRIPYREAPDGPWFYTDDTVMALSIVDVLAEHGQIEPDTLARLFARRFRRQPHRGYGAGAMRLLDSIAAGADWRTASPALFGGQGSMGNGGAMRAAPVGAYFADDVERVVMEAAASAYVTHAHPEGEAGAIAIAVGAAAACTLERSADRGPMLLETAHRWTPDGATRDGIAKAMTFDPSAAPEIVATALGSGQNVLASDTVPFALWSAAAHLDDFTDALWTTAGGLGDVDTTCAIVGGIVALSVGREGLPKEWLRRREPLDGWD